MALLTKIVEKHSLLSGSTVKLGFPDENGTLVDIEIEPTQLDQMLEGQQYELAFTFPKSSESAEKVVATSAASSTEASTATEQTTATAAT